MLVVSHNMADISEIPLVDFADFSLDFKEEQVGKEKLLKLADEVCDAFRTVGFVYLKNYGIKQSQVEEVQNIAHRFFQLELDAKEKYSRPNAVKNTGWLAKGLEAHAKYRPGDYKEVYDIEHDMENWPDEIPDFKSSVLDLFWNCASLANRVLFLIGLGLKLEDPYYFTKHHNPLENKSTSNIRLCYYPFAPDTEIETNQIWCSEHTDYGSITLLFQDEVGGLEVKNRAGKYIPATPIPETVVINVADMMQRWTSDELVSTWHRVIKPSSQIGTPKPRVSLAYFAHPDGDTLIEGVLGNKKYDPVNVLDYVDGKKSALYNY